MTRPAAGGPHLAPTGVHRSHHATPPAGGPRGSAESYAAEWRHRNGIGDDRSVQLEVTGYHCLMPQGDGYAQMICVLLVATGRESMMIAGGSTGGR